MPEIVFVEMRGNDQSGSITARGRTDEELSANARLIAAAPELLDAAKKTLKTLEAMDILEFERMILQSAIRKAQGK